MTHEKLDALELADREALRERRARLRGMADELRALMAALPPLPEPAVKTERTTRPKRRRKRRPGTFCPHPCRPLWPPGARTAPPCTARAGTVHG